MANRIKIIFFDMEGTIFKKVAEDTKYNTSPSAWTLLAQHLGKDAMKEEDNTKRIWTSKGYSSYLEWMEETIKIHKKYGLDKNFFEKVMSMIDFNPGVKETFDALRKRGFKTVLISGGFKAQADRAQKELKIDHSFAACEYFFDEKGRLTHWNLLPSDYIGKIDFMHLIIREYNFTREECAFVGDGKNDIPLAEEVGVSIAFNAAKELQNVCNFSINQEKGKEDFREILGILDKYEE